MLVLREHEIAPLLPIRDAVHAVERALRAQSDGTARMPLRIGVPAHAGILAAMPGSLLGEGGALGAKLVTVFEGNAELRIPTHQGAVMLFDPATGTPSALLDARYLTEVRTAAVSAVATRLLAAVGARVAAILGSGVQARSHALAMNEAMTLEELRIWGRNAERAEEAAAWAREQGLPARAVGGVAEAVRGAHVINTVTASKSPLFEAADVSPGAHLNAVGSSTPAARELPGALVGHARLFVDSREGAMSESGDVLLAIKEGALPAHPELTLLGDVLTQRAHGRRSPGEITLFDSLGIAVEDVACAALVVDRARGQGLGTEIAFP
ncbi:MAG TPA: ornithine cyclodeaminase family protein [Candidatus Dormibacteraeota bacterium]|nr:ornithine cyclodeaminase family protein [Candidatus Dormibacteraeota bacterium]